MLEVANLLGSRHELQALGNALVRLMVKMAVVPELEATGIGPEGDEPDFLRLVERTEDFHAHEAGLMIHQVRTMPKRLLDLGRFVIGDDEFAEGHERAGYLGGAPGRRRGEGGLDGWVKRTATGAGGWRFSLQN